MRKPITASVRAAIAVLVILTGMAAAPAARADQYRDSEDAHPLKIAYLFVYPVGKFLELTVTRPLAAAGRYIAPHHGVDEPQSRLCARERSARVCTSVAR
ncbi:MAG TPA: hypothetical protein VEC57_04225 [Candidatus Limnocylindrales bacterium]|nr:hypothetical protein [Candidatus Limnocylindrales bacterium]